ncbi:MAG: LysM peptidoglycan-binding domain-containing protein [Thalassovita mediterranea]|jgi:murein DD-endopeptidase MepM/ murein hydrolase activator NlpD
MANPDQQGQPEAAPDMAPEKAEEPEMPTLRPFTRPQLTLLGGAFLLAACSQPLDFDLRGNFNEAFNTADAAQNITADRPRPDQRGIISYPNYQVAVARRGDTVSDVAQRIGVNAQDLARHNGLETSSLLRPDEVLALPRRVSETAGGPIQPPSGVDIAALAGSAIDNASPQGVQTSTLDPVQPADNKDAKAVLPGADAPQTGVEPLQHRVARGETVYTISRLYGVSVKSLAEWNGLGPDFAIREGQFLLVPTASTSEIKPRNAAASGSVPGQGTPTPTPPSASKPLPREKTATAAQAQSQQTQAAQKRAPDLGKTQSASSSRMGFPVNGSIIREYSKGKNEGIDISAAPGTAIKAAANGTVAAITASADKVPIVVVKHPDNLLSVYANVSGITVSKGDSVKRGQTIAKIRSGESNYVHFEVRKGFNSVDPMPYVN